MELSFMLAADYANVTNNGKLNVMGIFSSINATKFPVKHPQMYIIAQLRVGPAEYGRNFTLELKLSCQILARCDLIIDLFYPFYYASFSLALA